MLLVSRVLLDSNIVLLKQTNAAIHLKLTHTELTKWLIVMYVKAQCVCQFTHYKALYPPCGHHGYCWLTYIWS